jgi:hypothetical protein
MKMGHLDDEPEPIIELCDEASCRESPERDIAELLKRNNGSILISELESMFEAQGDTLIETLENMVVHNAIKVKYSPYELL